MEILPLESIRSESESGPKTGSWRASLDRPARAAARALCAGVALASCQAYTPRPLDATAHRQAWHARALEGESLAEFLERLELVSLPTRGELDVSDGVDLEEGQLVALVFNPMLRLARLRVGKAVAGVEHAGRWADPRLNFTILRITESIPDPWLLSPGIGFSIPFSGRLAAQRDLAEAGAQAARAAALEAEWSLWRDVQVAWITWSAARMRAEETRRFVDALEALVQNASDLARRGEIPRTEASLFRLEELQRQSDLLRLSGEAEAREQELRALMGLAPGAPVELLPTLALPAAHEQAHVGASELASDSSPGLGHPSLARARRGYDVAEAALRREVRKQWPDLTFGPQSEEDAGQTRIGVFGVIPLPFLNANRRAIAEARVQRELARAAYETTYEMLVGRFAAASARVSSLTSQRVQLEQGLVPLVDRQLEDALELMRLGEGATLVWLESLTRAFRAKLDLIDARKDEALARTEASYLVGPVASVPVDDALHGAQEQP